MPFFFSLIFHILILILLGINITPKVRDVPPPVPVIIDLTQMKISDKTSLTPDKNATQKALKKVIKKAGQKKKESTQKSKVKKAMPLPTKAAPQKEEKKSPSKNSSVSDKLPLQTIIPPSKELDDLIKEIDQLGQKNELEDMINQIPEKIGPLTHKNVKGHGGGLMNNLTVSEVDFISEKIRQNWLVDIGMAGIDEIRIKIKVSLHQDGRVGNVMILNEDDYPQYQQSFKILSESARRAILICDSLGDESPFLIFPKKYSQNYSDWNEINFTFSPRNGTVF